MQCPNCRAEAAAGAGFCPNCGASLSGAAASPGVVSSGSSGLSDNAAGAIAYLTIIPAIIFLILEPYNKSLFVRFHSYQCIALAVVGVIVQIALQILFAIFHLIPVLGTLVGAVLSALLGFAVFVVIAIAWVIAIIKASQGVLYKLPFIGDYAEKLATSGSL